MAIPLSGITIPTPQPYDSDHPNRQRENYYYVLLQILDAMKTAEESVSFLPATDHAGLVAAVQDLAFTGEKIEIPALGIALAHLGKTLSITEV